MKMPPLLTERQRQLIPLLTVGCTRKEIADDLGISEETVRKHIRGLLQKFDAVNVRDAMQDLMDYDALYGPSGAKHAFFCARNNMTLTFQDDSLTTFLVDQDLHVVGSEVRELIDNLRTDGHVIRHTFHGKEQVPFKSRLNMDWFRYALDPPLKQGEVFHRYKELLLKDAFPDPIEFWQIGIEAPWSELNFQITFPRTRPPKRVWSEGRLNNRSLAIAPLVLSHDGLTATALIGEPKIGSQLLFHWEW